MDCNIAKFASYYKHRNILFIFTSFLTWGSTSGAVLPLIFPTSPSNTQYTPNERILRHLFIFLRIHMVFCVFNHGTTINKKLRNPNTHQPFVRLLRFVYDFGTLNQTKVGIKGEPLSRAHRNTLRI
jgi:hypothetical protein